MNRTEFSQEEIDNAIDWVNTSNASELIKTIIISCLKTVSTVNAFLMKNKISLKKLKSLFGFKTEKKPKNGQEGETAENISKEEKDSEEMTLSGETDNQNQEDDEPFQPNNSDEKKPSPKGHGRIHHDKYTGGDVVWIKHDDFFLKVPLIGVRA